MNIDNPYAVSPVSSGDRPERDRDVTVAQVTVITSPGHIVYTFASKT